MWGGVVLNLSCKIAKEKKKSRIGIRDGGECRAHIARSYSSSADKFCSDLLSVSLVSSVHCVLWCLQKQGFPLQVKLPDTWTEQILL